MSDSEFAFHVAVTTTVTSKETALLAWPPTVTTTSPVVAPVGTGTLMLVALQLIGVAAVPLNVTVLVSCVSPKFVPTIVTDVPSGPTGGVRLVTLGVDVPPTPTVTLLSVAVVRANSLWLVTAKPT